MDVPLTCTFCAGLKTFAGSFTPAILRFYRVDWSVNEGRFTVLIEVKSFTSRFCNSSCRFI